MTGPLYRTPACRVCGRRAGHWQGCPNAPLEWWHHAVAGALVFVVVCFLAWVVVVR